MRLIEIRYLVAMTAVLLLAFAFGAYGLNIDIIWGDEIWSLAFMGAFDPPHSPAQIVANIQELAPDHVPLFYLISAAWGSLVGWAPVALRYLSLLFGLLMIAWLYRFALEALNRRTALLASAMMTTTAFVIVYFHELRAYTFLMTFAIIHTWLYWRLTYQPCAGKWTWLAFVLTAAILLYTHHFSFALFAGLGISHLLYAPRSARWLRVIIAWGSSALLFLPYLPPLVSGAFAFGSSERANSTWEVLQAFATVLVNGCLVFWAPLLLAFVYRIRRDRNPVIIHLTLTALVMCLAMIILNQQFGLIAITRMRYFLIVWWLLAIVFAAGLAAAPRRQILMPVFLILWAAAGFTFGQSDGVLQYTGFISVARAYPPLHQYTENLIGQVKSTDYLLGFTKTDWVNYDRDTMRGYSALDYYLKAQLGIVGEFIDIASQNWEIRRDIEWILDERPSLLLASHPHQYQRQTETAKSAILRRFDPCPLLAEKPDLLMRRYAHPLLGCARDPAPIHYENNIRILDYAAQYDTETERVRALIWWQIPDEKMLDEYNISLQIMDQDWRNRLQIDHHLDSDILPWQVFELSTAELPAADYTLALILYRRDTGERIHGMDIASGEIAKILPLLAFSADGSSADK